MPHIDPLKNEMARRLFPELSDVQFEISLSFSFGSSRKSIAQTRGISHQAVSKALIESCDKFDLSSPNELRPLFFLRLGLAQL